MPKEMPTPRMILSWFKPTTHTLEIADCPAREWLIDQGYIKWHPPIFGSNRQYEITPKGLAYREGAKKYGESNWQK